jgi:hypothetical protein
MTVHSHRLIEPKAASSTTARADNAARHIAALRVVSSWGQIHSQYSRYSAPAVTTMADWYGLQREWLAVVTAVALIEPCHGVTTDRISGSSAKPATMLTSTTVRLRRSVVPIASPTRSKKSYGPSVPNDSAASRRAADLRELW